MSKIAHTAARLAASLARVPSGRHLSPTDVASDAITLASLNPSTARRTANTVGAIAARYSARVVWSDDPHGMTLGFQFDDPAVTDNPARVLFVV